MRPDMSLDAARTALITDSGADVPVASRPPNWRVVPLTIVFGSESFRDGVDLSTDQFYRRLKEAPEPPTTAQPSVGEMAEAMRAALDDYESALVLCMSEKLSGTADAARHAAGEVHPDRIMVLESGTVALGLGLLGLRLQALLESGCRAADAERHCAALRARQRLVVVLETLEYLERGGRIGRAEALAGSLLRVHPILEVDDGEVVPAGRVRGAHRVLPAIERYVAERTEADRPLYVAIGHTRRPDAVSELERLVERARPDAEVVLRTEVGATVGTHAGPGAIGLALLNE